MLCFLTLWVNRPRRDMAANNTVLLAVGLTRMLAEHYLNKSLTGLLIIMWISTGLPGLILFLSGL